MAGLCNSSQSDQLDHVSNIHLDMRGGLIKLFYYKCLFPFIKSLGAKCVFIDREDTFPYIESLRSIGNLSTNSRPRPYSPHEARLLTMVTALLDKAKAFELSAFTHLPLNYYERTVKCDSGPPDFWSP